MTVFVTVQASGDMTHLCRYETKKGLRRPLCTHAGLYDPESVSNHGIAAYLRKGASQDRIGNARCLDVAACGPA